MTEQPEPTARVRIVLWPEPGDADFPAGDTSLTEANAIELREFARDYAGVPLLELMQRLRRAEWNAAEYQRQAEQAREISRRMPALSQIQEMDARHRRVRGLLEGRGAISRADLRAALTESTVPTP